MLDNDSLKQQEIIYNEDYQIQQLERRINRMQGEQSNEEKQAMEAKIKQLNDELEKKIAVHDVLTLQLKRLQVCVNASRLCQMVRLQSASPVFDWNSVGVAQVIGQDRR